MDVGSINWLAVMACVVVAMISGFIWYHPKVFFPPWWAGIGKSGDQGNPNPIIYVFTIIAAAVQAVFISFMINTMGSTTVASGALAGLSGRLDLAGLLPLVTLPRAWRLAAALRAETGQALNGVLRGTAGLMLRHGALLALGIVWG